MLYLSAKFFWNFSFTEHWTLNFSERGGLSGHQLFWSCQIWGQKFFRIFFIYRLLWTLNFSGEGGPGTNFFWSCQIWVQKVFRIFSFTKCSGLWSFQLEDWSRHQLFLVILNLRSTTFRIFSFTEQSVIFSVIFCKGIQDTNIFWSHQIWGQKFFRIFFLLYQVLWTLNFL